MNKKIIIESLSMDLLRVALGLHRGSLKMAKRFKAEALKRERELEQIPMDSYTEKLTQKTKATLTELAPKKAEEILMLSVLFRNKAQEPIKG